MSEVTHTPGPWKATKGHEDEPDRWVIVAAGEKHFHIATIENGQPGDTLETEGHTARLIAAAPEMLEALQRTLSLIQESHGVFGFHLNGDLSDWSEHQDDIDVIQNAIAKATGEEEAE